MGVSAGGGFDLVLTDDLGRALLVECKRRGISQSQASARFGVSKQTFNEWINGKRRIPPGHAREIASFLRLPVRNVRAVIDIPPRTDRMSMLEDQLIALAEHLEELALKLRKIEELVDHLGQ